MSGAISAPARSRASGAASSARIDDGLLALRERKRVLDVAWLAMLVVLAIATSVPWFFRILDIDYAPVAKLLVGFGLLYVAVAIVVDMTTSRRALRAGTIALQITGIVFLGALWLVVGGLQTPVFLIVFVIPIVTSGVLLLGHRPVAPVAAVLLVVVTAAFLNDPGLRWYLLRVGLPLESVFALMPGQPIGARPFPQSQNPSSSALALLLFGVLACAIGAMTASMSSFVRSLYRRIRTAAVAASDAEELWLEVLRAATLPSALVHRDTAGIVAASGSFVRDLLLDERELSERSLFELVDFATPEFVERVLSGETDRASSCPYRVGGETRVCRVVGYPIRHDDADYVYLTLEDFSDLSYLESALDAVEDAYLVVAADGRIRYSNRRARAILGDIERGTEASTALAVDDAPGGWWHPGARTRHERTVRLSGSPYEANLSSAVLPGEPGRLTVVRLRPQAAA